MRIWDNDYNKEDMYEDREHIELVEAESDDRCCGSCDNFKYEDPEGFGLCVAFNVESYCGYVCVKNCKFKPYKR